MKFAQANSEITAHQPRVSVGLPVYNGERFLARAIEAHLNQTFEDLELIISDNCSTDGTAEICRKYAADDARVRYIRQQKNVGVNRNHYLTYEAAHSADYFRWAGVDDLPPEDLVEDAVGRLDDRADVVLYVPKAIQVDTDGNLIRKLNRELNLTSEDPVERARLVLERGGQMTYAQGLIRKSALDRTARRWNYFGWDYILLLELALLGKFLHGEGPLFHRVIHEKSAALNTRSASEVRKWVDPTMKGRFLMPHWKWLFERARVTASSGLRVTAKAKLCSFIFRHAWWGRQSLWKDIKGAVQMSLGRTDVYPF